MWQPSEPETVFAAAPSYAVAAASRPLLKHSIGVFCIHTKSCSLSIVLTATDQKPQKSLKR